ncbi:MAG: c-type cytochrome, partial [Planctomycetaceae bacterium]|nr:c-type cytochrome [Planctomycetaceae bacterium]
VGANGTFPPRFRSGLGENGGFDLPAGLLQPGQLNTIAIRVYQNDPRPNFSVAPPVLVETQRKQGIRLEGNWQYGPGDESAWALAVPSDFGLDPDALPDEAVSSTRGLYLRIDTVEDIEQYATRRNGDTDPLSPQDALSRFTTPADLRVELVLSDPVIAQPLFMTWDDRGRLWLAEYRQYPDPAGLTMISRDTFLRSVYDKVPPPPPNHFRGADRITIHEDTDEDGVYDTHKTFVDGLNIATSCAIGRDGVYITNPPYLLFYPDRDGDDIPDGDPEVLLEGFGLEDSHSVINSLRFGPDGWLYGAQGSTVTAVVRRPGSEEPPIRTAGQQIWRYHPERRVFEVFAEGGGNTFGCEIDAHGRIYSGHNGGDTRGFHYVQGGYYRKGFGKHGPLSNPYAFGFFENMKHHSVARFTHNFIIYEEGLLPDRFSGKLLGIEPLQGQVVLSDVRPDRSSFQTEDIERVLKTDDPWFRPVDIKAGPDGSVYVADMYEQRIDHSSHYAGRIDRTSGRIYRLVPAGKPSPAVRRAPGMQTWSDERLLEELQSPAKWKRQSALRVIGDRGSRFEAANLEQRLAKAAGQDALELLWAFHLTGGLTEEAALRLLKHPDPFVRAWTIRMICDEHQISQRSAAALAVHAQHEGYIEVRTQLASSAKRLPPALALPIINALLNYDEDVSDIHQPLLIWWALEAQVGPATMAEILPAILADAGAWQRPMVRQVILERLMKRYALSGTREDLMAAAAVLQAAPDRAAADTLLKGFEEAFQGRSLAGIPDELATAIADSGGGSLALRVRQGQPEAVAEAVQVARDPQADQRTRRQLVELFGQVSLPTVHEALLQLVETDKSEDLVAAAISGLQTSQDPRTAEIILTRYATLGETARLAAESTLSSRLDWSRRLLKAVDQGMIPGTAISEQSLRKILLFADPGVNQIIARQYGEVAGASTDQMRAEMDRIAQILSTGTGNPKTGKVLFMKNCGRCHLLFEEGGKVGPDLTPFARTDLNRMLSNIVNPNLEIREGFETQLILTNDGRILTGFLADRDTQVVILRGVDGQNVIVRHDDIDEMRAVPQSVMPEGTLKELNEQQLRDLFAYLRASQPVNY